MTQRESIAAIKAAGLQKDFIQFQERLRAASIGIRWCTRERAWKMSGFVGMTYVSTYAGAGPMIEYIKDFSKLIAERQQFVTGEMPAESWV